MSAIAGGRVCANILYRPPEPFRHADENVDAELSDKHHLGRSICTLGSVPSEHMSPTLAMRVILTPQTCSIKIDRNAGL